MATVLKIGGSVLGAPNDAAQLQSYLSLLNDTPEIVGVVVGGGTVARQYIETGRGLNMSESNLDRVGISVTDVNAELVSGALTRKATTVPNFTGANTYANIGYLPVMGSTTPEQTTDTVAVQLAEHLGAERLIIATDIDGVYSADPDTTPDAARYDSLSIDEARSIIAEHTQAGTSTPIGRAALNALADTTITTYVIDGSDASSVKSVLDNLSSYPGTRIAPTN